MVRLKPKQGDALTFTLALKSPADGRIFLRAMKLGVNFCDALIQSDGSFSAYLGRSNEVVSGNLKSLLPEGATGNLALLVNDLKDGPLPAGAQFAEVDATTLRTVDPATGFECLIKPSPNGPTVASKTLVHQIAAFREDYAQYREFEGLHRPTIITLAASTDPDLVTTIKISDLDVVPSISDTGMTLRVPDKAVKITLDEFMRRLTE